MTITAQQLDDLRTALEPWKGYGGGLGILLGSGLGGFIDRLEVVDELPYEHLPHFPLPSVKGHRGVLSVARLGSTHLLAFAGRFHYYEGHSPATAALPVRVMQLLGCKGMIVTNAAGGINPSFRPGDLMILEDHINFMGVNPLRGENRDELGPRFPDCSTAYDPSYRRFADEVAATMDLQLRHGVYAAVAGPSYETPAEIRMLGRMGADAVGMSTVPEVITARHAGIRVLGISCISNLAAGISKVPLDHKEVIEVTERIKHTFASFLIELMPRMAANHE